MSTHDTLIKCKHVCAALLSSDLFSRCDKLAVAFMNLPIALMGKIMPFMKPAPDFDGQDKACMRARGRDAKLVHLM